MTEPGGAEKRIQQDLDYCKYQHDQLMAAIKQDLEYCRKQMKHCNDRLAEANIYALSDEDYDQIVKDMEQVNRHYSQVVTGMEQLKEEYMHMVGSMDKLKATLTNAAEGPETQQLQ